MDGWIKLHRKLLEWCWYKNSNMVHLFLHIILKANHKDKNWQGILIKKGQLITGRKSLAEDTGITEQSIRTCLDKLKSTSEITIKSTNKYSLITICNYDNYNNLIEQPNQQINQQSNQQLTTNKKYKNKNKRNHLFKNSKYFDIELIKSDIGDKYKKYNLSYYYEAVKNWSESSGALKKDWLATLRGFILKDVRENKAKLK